MAPRPPIEILPIQIREDVTVQIAGIPHDLTREEAEKIARVVMAMAMPEVADDSKCFRVASEGEFGARPVRRELRRRQSPQ